MSRIPFRIQIQLVREVSEVELLSSKKVVDCCPFVLNLCAIIL